MIRPESSFIRALRAADLEVRMLRTVDLILWVIGAAVLLAVLVASMISIIDWLEGRPDSIVPAILAALDVLDGVRR